MIPAFKEDYDNIIDILSHAKSEIDKIKNPDILSLTTRMRFDLEKHINMLKTRIGDAGQSQAVRIKQPLLKVMGKIVATPEGTPVETPKPIITASREIEKEELKQKVEDIYTQFYSTPTDQLWDTLSDIEVRAVAKKAGLPVTDSTPKRITPEFINTIKGAIQKHMAAPVQNVNDLDIKDLQLTQGALPPAESNFFNQTNDKLVTTSENTMLLNELTQLSNNAILEAYEPEQIIGFAAMAGIQAPANVKVDSKFVTQIKEAVKAQNT